MSKVLAGLVVFSMGFVVGVFAEDDGGRVIAKVYGQEITAKQQPQLAGLIFRGLRGRFCKEHGLEVTPEDLDGFVRANERMEGQTLARLEKERARLAEEVKGTGLTEEKRKRVEDQLKVTEGALTSLATLREQMKGQEALVAEARKDVGRPLILNWKFNRALYERYGGRVIFQQAGPEPLDAMRDFLKEEEGKGSFVILDESAAEGFWKYYVTDGMHTFAPADEGKRLMGTPWWVMEEGEGFEN